MLLLKKYSVIWLFSHFFKTVVAFLKAWKKRKSIKYSYLYSDRVVYNILCSDRVVCEHKRSSVVVGLQHRAQLWLEQWPYVT